MEIKSDCESYNSYWFYFKNDWLDICKLLRNKFNLINNGKPKPTFKIVRTASSVQYY